MAAGNHRSLESESMGFNLFFLFTFYFSDHSCNDVFFVRLEFRVIYVFMFFIVTYSRQFIGPVRKDFSTLINIILIYNHHHIAALLRIY